ncbi:hypothetical protein CPC08DRAFT_728638 [Agrocybe pediades]|nr:hypothetical protein CPC08DRAFT_728638 [Agrocybe pediades]
MVKLRNRPQLHNSVASRTFLQLILHVTQLHKSSVPTSEPPQTLLDTTSPAVITVQKGRKRSRKLSTVNPVPPRELRRRGQPAPAPVSKPPAKKRRKSKKKLWHYEDMEGNLVDKDRSMVLSV